MDHYFFFTHGRRYDPLPGFNGFIVVELSDRPVRYHIQPTFIGGMNADECHTMALAACRIACTSADAVRGKLSVDRLHRAMTQPCLERLRTMQYLLDTHMLTHPSDKAKFCYLPTVPTLIDGVIVSQETLEMAVFMTIGQEDVRVTLRFRFIGSRWMCQYADLG
ncbi:MULTISPECIES: hypothetical protein [Bifidobacterium]|uniref:hypothetical protein n=1 Tax=Bifidobacterium TaxID=1678 RepID=UPI001F0B04BF|nr:MULTISPECIES: hypothetical protein [Bifidobacterium]